MSELAIPTVGMHDAELHLKIGDITNIFGGFEVEVVERTPGMPEQAVAAVNIITVIDGLRGLARELEMKHGLGQIEEASPETGRFRIRLSDLAGTLMDRSFGSRELAQDYIDRTILSMPKHRVDPRWVDAVVEEMEA